MILERLHGMGLGMWLLFRNFCPKGFATVTYPQFPLVHNIDTPDSDGEEESDEELDDQESLYPLLLIKLLPAY
jgi:hypothetical protein